MRTKKKGVFLPPLFDRLTLDAPDRLDEEGVKASVAKELFTLLNTRSVVRQDIDPKEGEVLSRYPPFFGFPDFSRALFENKEDVKKKIVQVVRLYEKRLREPEVESIDYHQEKRTYSVCLKGFLMLGDRRVPVTFPIDVINPG